MTEQEHKMMEMVGAAEADFLAEEKVTVADLVEALDILTGIVLGGSEDD